MSHFSGFSEESRAKFAPDGTPLRCTGATVLCHLRQDEAPNAIYGSIIDNCYDVSKNQWLSKFVQLPKESLHMTILDVKVYRGTTKDNTEDKRGSDMMRYRTAFDDLRSDLKQFLPIKMTIDLGTDRYPQLDETLKVPVMPYDDRERDKLRSIRTMLSTAFGMPSPDEAYPFHITGYYALQTLSEEQFSSLQKHWAQAVVHVSEAVSTFEIDRIELCTFESMFHFEVQELVTT